MADYHDREWGMPSRDDRHLFEMLTLEGAQAGLSWSTILAKRERYRRVYDGFDAVTVAGYGPEKQTALLDDPGIVRNRLKVAASISNAGAFVATAHEHDTFAAYLWGWVGDTPVVHTPRTMADLIARDDLSDELSKDLKRRGFRFVGSTIVYSFLQSVGLVDDHLVGCPAKTTGPAGRPA
jgi:DNA-3-methyladenine glycosylase I